MSQYEINISRAAAEPAQKSPTMNFVANRNLTLKNFNLPAGSAAVREMSIPLE